MSSSSSKKVELYRYDLTNGMAAQMAPMLIGRPLEGVWHTSIVIDEETEYYFDGGVGILGEKAGQTRFGRPHRSEVLGYTTKTIAEFKAWNEEEMRSKRFGPDSYNLMNCNCNHYSQAASQFLLGKDIPEDVRLMIPMLLSTPLGALVAPMLQQVAAATGSGGVGASPFGGGGWGSVPTAAATTPAAASHTSSTPALDADTQESLEIFVALISSDDADEGVKRTTFEAIERILSNIRNNPTNQQYQRLSLTSEFYRTRIAKPFDSASEVLALAGFVADADGAHLVFKGDVHKLPAFIAEVQKAKAAL